MASEGMSSRTTSRGSPKRCVKVFSTGAPPFPTCQASDLHTSTPPLLNQLRQRAAALRAGPTIAEIDERIKALDQEKQEQEAKLERLKGSATVPKDKFVKVQANLVDYAAKWKKYRAMFMEVWGSVADGLPGVKNERDYLENTIGCDLDPKGATWKDFQAKHLPMGAANKRQRVR